MAIRILALDANFNNLGGIKYINLQWNRGYYSYGTFEMQCLARDYNPSTAYLYTPDRPETGMVQKIKYQKELAGQFMILSGFFLEKRLDDAITWTSESSPTFFANGNIEDEIRRMVETYKGDIPIVLAPATGLGSNVEFQSTARALGVACNERLQAQGLAYRCSYAPDDGVTYFSVWEGKNRTQAQSENSFVVFSSAFGNLGDTELTIDNSNYKNFAVVGGEGKGTARYYAQADASNGEYKRKVFVDSRNARYDSETQTEVQYRAALRQDGFDALLDKYYIVENARITAAGTVAALNGKSGALVYMQDYDLGDLCDVILTEIGVKLSARIISVKEIVKQNQHLVELELGEAILTRTEKARL